MKTLVLNSTPHETRVGILEDGQLTEIFVERARKKGIAGNVYKGVVAKVLPGMQSAFVDLGLEKNAFLYVSDVAEIVDDWSLDDAYEDDVEVSGPPMTQNEQNIADLLKEGQEILSKSGLKITPAETLQDAGEKAVAAARGTGA